MSKRIALALAFALLAAAGAAFVVFGRFNIDEGMHLNAGRLIYEHGRLPYRDFPFSQGPGGPFLYGAAGALFGSSLLVGRSVSLVLNLLGIGALARLATRFSGLPGALIVLGFTLVNFPALWAFSQVRTEPPAIALAGFAALAWFHRRGSWLRWALPCVLLVGATTFRLSYAIPLLVACGLVAFELRHAPRRVFAVAAIVLASGLVASWPLWAFPAESFFHVVTSQLDRAERLGWADFPLSARIWYFGRLDSGFQPILVATALPLVLLMQGWQQGWRVQLSRDWDPMLAVAALFAMAALTFLPLLVFRVGFFQYFVNASLLLVAAIAIAAPRLAGPGGRAAVATWSVLFLCGSASALLAVVHVDTWLDPQEATVRRLAALRERIQRLTPGGCSMLTFETYLAVETGCDVLPGLEYSYFSFFPQLDVKQARVHGVLDRDLLARSLSENEPELLALTRSGVRRMTGRQPAADRWPRLPGMRRRYRLIEVLDLPVGPIHTFREQVFIYARRDLAYKD